MPTAMRWQVKAPDGTKTLHRTLRDALANYPQDASLKRVSVITTRGPQKRAPRVRVDQPPTVPARRAPDPAPQPGERIDAWGNVVRGDK